MSAKDFIFVKADVSAVARYHYVVGIILWISVILFFVAVAAVLMGASQEHPFARYFNVVDISFRIGAMVAIYKLAASLKEPRPWIYVLGMLFPLLNLVILAYVLNRATRALRANNIRVGWWGCNKEDLENYLSGNWEKK